MPWVLAILRDESIDSIRAVAALATPELRAELRGLGAMLLIVSGVGVWSFDPDTAVELVGPRDATIDREVAHIAGRHGVPPYHDAVFVIDGDGSVQFAHASRRSLGPMLSLALAEAGREQISRAKRIRSRAELLLSSLCTGFAVAMLGSIERFGRQP